MAEAGTPPSRPQGKQTSKSRFFGPQKKRPWEESDENGVEQIEILSSRNDDDAQKNNDAQPTVTAKDAARHQNEENNSSLKLENECVKQDATAENPNPFAQFAFGGAAASKATDDNNAAPTNKKKKWTTISTSKKACVKNKNTSKKEKQKDWIRMVDCSKEEQERIVEKWHSLADPNASLVVRRFQVLVAARLHARCQEPVVRKCMEALRVKYVPLDAATLSKVNPDGLAESLSSLQYYNVKAKHVVAAANEVQRQFGGRVPEKESELRTITGIGPVMADLLAFVNTIERHTRTQSSD